MLEQYAYQRAHFSEWEILMWGSAKIGAGAG